MHPAAEPTPSAVPDVLAPGLEVLFCAINPGRVSAAAAAHFANPRNDFWRLLAAAGFTSRVYLPEEQFALPALGIGLTNAAYRTTPGSSDLRAADYAESAERLGRLATDLQPRVIAFVGKEAYRGTFRERPDHGLQERRLGAARLFVLPSTSPANAAVPWEERLRWFKALRDHVAPVVREAVRAVVLDPDGAVLLVRFEFPWADHAVWALPGGGLEPGESVEDGIRRELAEETGLHDATVGPVLWTRTPRWRTTTGGWGCQREQIFLIQTARFDLRPQLAAEQLREEYVTDVRWWSRDELASSDVVFAPRALQELLRSLPVDGAAPEPLELD
jgi:G:T/U-mismatch repair DNA glycosylase/ADP-ribose pyrophosphatase YjhB (NUDIX family)